MPCWPPCRESSRGRCWTSAARRDVTVNQLAEVARRRLGRTEQSIRHVPREVLRALAATERLPRVPVGQVAALALAMDTLPMTYAALHRADAVQWRGVLHPDDIPAVPAH